MGSHPSLGDFTRSRFFPSTNNCKRYEPREWYLDSRKVERSVLLVLVEFKTKFEFCDQTESCPSTIQLCLARTKITACTSPLQGGVVGILMHLMDSRTMCLKYAT